MISSAYRQEQQKLHENPDYGVASVSFAPIITQLINTLGVTEILDYGCGKARLAKSIKPNHEVTVNLYDPGVIEYSATPDSAQMVCCIDVLEHIEPEHLDAVLDDLQRCVEFFGVFSIHTGPAIKTLSDGRNAHLIQQPAKWWLPKLLSRFDLMSFSLVPNGFFVVVKRGADNLR